MKIYYVGTGVGMFSLKKCVEMASSGDVIEFTKSDYAEDIGSLNLDKSMTIKGHIQKNQDGSIHYASCLKGMIFVKNQAKVVLENLWIYNNKEQANLLNCKGKSEVEAHSVVLENSQTTGEVYPLIYGESSTFTFTDLSVQASEYRYNSIFFINCELVINNSTIRECMLKIDKNSKCKLSASKIYFNQEDAAIFVCGASQCEIDNVNLMAKNLEYAAVCGIGKSYFSIRNSTIKQETCAFALLLREHSDLEIEHCDVTSIESHQSKVKITDSTVREIIQSRDDSCILIADAINLMGENSGKIDVYVVNHSAVYGERISLNRVIDPNIRVEDHSACAIQMLEYTGGNVKDLIIEVGGDSTFVCHSMHDIVEKGAAPQNVPAGGGVSRVDSQNTRQALDNLIGLSSVKKEIDRMISMVNLNKKRMEMGLEPEPISLHSVFMGNPGTGKTTVARMIGEILWEAGAFKGDEFKFIEATEPDLVSSNVGQTAEKTFALLEKAKGGVLFIDEAYVLNKKDSSVNFGQEAINSILKYMEDHRDEIMIIFAGYTTEMEQFLRTNPGLESRVPNTFVFDDYSPEEIVAMGTKMLLDKKYTFENQDYYRYISNRYMLYI
ncbi:MAG: AAA family ATPase, partial [Lachnospiraceae bacterium]